MITAAVVLYNTDIELLETVIESYSPSEERKLFIIDNYSVKSDYCMKLQNANIEYIFCGKNLGYGSAHNIGIRKAIEIQSSYHIILNPDLSFDSEVINRLIEYADMNRDVVYILPKVIYPDGDIQYLCKLLPTPFDLIFRRFLPKTKFTQKWNDRYILKESGYNTIINPPCLSGCFMFLRTATLKKYNLEFDERFFMYCEDFDLMRRLHRVGETIYYPEVEIVHNHERGSYKSKKMMLMHIKSACKYFNKYGWIFDKERNQQNRKILKEIAFIKGKNETITRS